MYKNQNEIYKNNYNSSFQQNSPMINRDTWHNTNGLMHNNVAEHVLLDSIIDNYILIDSDDRNINAYCDPFSYVVSFKPLGKSVVHKTKTRKDGTVDYTKTIYEETPAPNIMRSFKNVKCITLDNVILSKFCLKKFVIDQTLTIVGTAITPTTTLTHISSKERINLADSSQCPVCLKSLCVCVFFDRYKYIVLKIKELELNRIYATNTTLSSNSFVLYVDKTLGNSNNIWKPMCGICEFPSSQLGNIDRLSIDFFSKSGDKVSVNLYIVFNFTINYNSSTYTVQVCLVFGDIDDYLVASINGLYPIVIFMRLDQFFKPELWFRKIYNELTKQTYSTDTQGIKNALNHQNGEEFDNYNSIYDAIIAKDIQGEYTECSSNNLFFVISALQNELNTLPQY